ncbi:C1 family peptidase [Humisphaera borealis]|uniref:C1 family peptidase n=1 Tax=Humisphaera borealis TaxID=2807512 RepID=A0A7M2WXQ7_9BACT|nr:C1 family peptidase [Humisphaera borealis]QOV90199.1 C1 family peptidase [Humisphaera borealis]
MGNAKPNFVVLVLLGCFASSVSAEKLSYREFCGPVRDQGDSNACVAFATIAAMEITYKRETGRDLDLSEQDLLNKSGHNLGVLDTPNAAQIALATVVKFGVCEEEKMPWRDKDLAKRAKLNDVFRAVPLTAGVPLTGGPIANVASLKTALKKGPVIVHLNADPLQGVKTDRVIVSRGRPNHAVVLTGYDDDRQAFEVRNSWAEDWGVGGYGFVSYKSDFWGACGFVPKSVTIAYAPRPKEGVEGVLKTGGEIVDAVGKKGGQVVQAGQDGAKAVAKGGERVIEVVGDTAEKLRKDAVEAMARLREAEERERRKREERERREEEARRRKLEENARRVVETAKKFFGGKK